MGNADFSLEISADQSPEEVYNAINRVGDWWTGETTGTTDQVGAEFVYQYKDKHRSVQKITELIPGKRVVWHVTEASMTFLPEPDEWKGTDIIFDITKEGDKTKLNFTHKGLTPKFICYGDCSGAWTGLINNNLKTLIQTGKSQTV